jgi:hypothetical protein
MSNSGGDRTREVKLPVAPPSDLVFPRGQNMKMDGGKKVRLKLMSNVYAVQVCSVLGPRR